MKRASRSASSNDFEVRGQITRSSKAAVAGATLRIYDQDLRKRQKLAETKTDAHGAYRAFYHSEQFSRAEQGGADLVVVVSDADDVVLTTSPIRFNAKPLETIDLVVSDPSPAAKSEYENVLRAVLPLLAGQDVELYMLEETPGHRDFSFLAQETGLSIDRIVAVVNAGRLDQQATASAAQKKPVSQVAAGAGDGDRVALPAVFYGLLRQGLPANLTAILALTPAVQRSALQTSLRQNIIPAALSKRLDAVLAVLQAVKASQVLQPAPTAGSISLGDLLTSSLPQDVRTAVAQLYVQSGADVTVLQAGGQRDDSLQNVESAGDLRKFATALDGGAITAAQENQVKAALAFNQLTGSYTPLIQELARMGNVDATFADPKSLTTLTHDDWAKILARPKDPQKPDAGAVGHPSGFASDADYAESLMQSVAATYPTAAFGAGLGKDLDAKSPNGRDGCTMVPLSRSKRKSRPESLVTTQMQAADKPPQAATTASGGLQ
jgi:hypothetical protein